MAAYTWPATLPDPSKQYQAGFIRPILRSKDSAGYEHTRPKFTRTRRIYKLHWAALTLAQVETITDFFEDDTKFGGEAFNFTIPDSSPPVTIEVRLNTDEIMFNWVSADYRSVSLEFKEV